MPTWNLSFPGAGIFAGWRWCGGRSRAGKAPTHLAPPPGSRELSARRAEAMRGFFPKLASWIDQRGFTAEMNEVNRFLSQAADIHDLERRVRDIDRRHGTPRWYQ
jgi:hypothetical protein